ncbi:hypothetical protein F1737_02845 [Methanoplanus sp. FWC-SCC4]|uniref:Uncharacterized protein n=1 Tax=Methanochimaera problematica TaxID=2609417 RepID=A0AA97FB27_9EURY|nr:hypothetical protein [Methanoplanus sp. FWC-SCC4]WOF15699.1 hypothetical protein F1737_02845 [Methanoplanus sp. FWC-SCC4]
MDDKKWIMTLALVLFIASASLYSLHFLIFHDLHHIGVFALHELAFLPLEVLIVTLVIHKLLDTREKKKQLEKMNMVIGTFFSVIGTSLISCFSKNNPNITDVKNLLRITDKWTDSEFDSVEKKMKVYDFEIDISSLNLEKLKAFLIQKEDFMIRLLENPVLLEHEKFTELLRATFHLTEELHKRNELSLCPETDIKHLEGDINRVYDLLADEWLEYMQYLKSNYPYLFSLALRTNPFDDDATIIIK